MIPPPSLTDRDQITRDEFIARNRPPLPVAVNLKHRQGLGERGRWTSYMLVRLIRAYLDHVGLVPHAADLRHVPHLLLHQRRLKSHQHEERENTVVPVFIQTPQSHTEHLAVGRQRQINSTADILRIYQVYTWHTLGMYLVYKVYALYEEGIYLVYTDVQSIY